MFPEMFISFSRIRHRRAS